MNTKRNLMIAAAAALLVAGVATPAFADGADHGSLSFGIIGDMPYGSAEIAAFPS